MKGIYKLVLLLGLLSLLNVASSADFLKSEASVDDLKTKLESYSRQNLELIALAAEKYDRTKRDIDLNILGGLVNYVWRIDFEDVIKIIKDYTDLYPELKEEGKLEQLANISTQTKDQTLSQYLKTFDNKTLQNMALSAEKYARTIQGLEGLDGGLVDYIWRIDDSDIIDIIKEFVDSYPELGKNNLLETLGKNPTLDTNEILERLEKRNKTTLIQWALACDEYDRSLKPRLGGLHDYIYSLKRNEVIDAFVVCLKLHPHLTLDGEIEKIAAQYSDNHPGVFGGIMDYLPDFNRKELIQLAIHAEEFHREKRGQTGIIGGIHDYIHRLDNSLIFKMIQGFIEANSELREAGKLESLANIKKGGFIGTFRTYQISKLKKICLSLEAYYRNIEGIHPKGGLHDYIDTLTIDGLIEYIKVMTDRYEELNSVEIIEKLLVDFPTLF